MIKIRIVLILLILNSGNLLFAQALKDFNGERPNVYGKEKPKVQAGLGLGLDYGGFGIRLTYDPIKYAGIFGSVGYAFIGTGYNVGVNVNILPDYRFCPYLTGMYGYNAVIHITGASQYDKIYYGPSFGLGFQYWNRSRRNYFNVEFLYPQRSDEYDKDIKALKSNPSVKLSTVPPDFAISFGYHIGLGAK